MHIIISKEDINNTVHKSKRLVRMAERIESARKDLSEVIREYSVEFDDFKSDLRSYIKEITGTEPHVSPSEFEINSLGNDKALNNLKDMFNAFNMFKTQAQYISDQMNTYTTERSLESIVGIDDNTSYGSINDIEGTENLRYPRVGTPPFHVLTKRVSDIKRHRYSSKPMEYTIRLESIVDNKIVMDRLESKFAHMYMQGNSRLKEFYTSDAFEDLIQYAYKNNVRKIDLYFGHRSEYGAVLYTTLWTNPSEDTKALFSMIEDL